MPPVSPARRAFLARIGVLGAATGAGVLLPPALPILVDLLRPVLAELARDTLNGLTTFVVPGPDCYSRSHGTSALANALGGPNPTLTTQAVATRTAEHSFPTHFGGSPWVGKESPVISTDPRISAALAAKGL
ncbi:hypothetical protein JOF53_003177 [Crossiella equi]|uniref:Twin-arginine translocation signal domain-containing protein n=1 Tax=Crossiella equi TaxID=130796 RepID=A0ABS5ACK0_9PSEU|nr:hypothetical protein [Crossiella equi]MBP2474305.1 hypothetical protein [Crossiella equi]